MLHGGDYSVDYLGTQGPRDLTVDQVEPGSLGG